MNMLFPPGVDLQQAHNLALGIGLQNFPEGLVAILNSSNTRKVFVICIISRMNVNQND